MLLQLASLVNFVCCQCVIHVYLFYMHVSRPISFRPTLVFCSYFSIISDFCGIEIVVLKGFFGNPLLQKDLVNDIFDYLKLMTNIPKCLPPFITLASISFNNKLNLAILQQPNHFLVAFFSVHSYT